MKKNFYKVFIILFSVTIILTIVSLYFLNNKPKRTINSTISISSEEKNDIQNLTNTFMNKAGVFGVKMDTVNADNLLSVSSILGSSSSAVNDYTITRESAYDSLRSMIYNGSPLDYDSNDVAVWSYPTEVANFASYNISNIKINVPSKGLKIGKDKSATVNIVFDSTETMLFQTADDSTWDGSWREMGKTFYDNSMQLTVIKDNGKWKVYSQNAPDKPFLLSTWKTPSDTVYEKYQHNFNEVKILKMKTPLKTEENE